MNLFLPDCEGVSYLTSQSMDEPLSLRKRVGMRFHIMFCVFCRRNAEQLKLIRKFIRIKTTGPNLSDTDINEFLSQEARQRIARAVKSTDVNDSPPSEIAD